MNISKNKKKKKKTNKKKKIIIYVRRKTLGRWPSADTSRLAVRRCSRSNIVCKNVILFFLSSFLNSRVSTEELDYTLISRYLFFPFPFLYVRIEFSESVIRSRRITVARKTWHVNGGVAGKGTRKRQITDAICYFGLDFALVLKRAPLFNLTITSRNGRGRRNTDGP